LTLTQEKTTAVIPKLLQYGPGVLGEINVTIIKRDENDSARQGFLHSAATRQSSNVLVSYPASLR